MVELQRCTDKEQWDGFVLEHGGHPLQLWPWGQVKASHGWLAERIFAYENDEIIGAAQVLIRPLPAPFRSFAYLPRGPVFISRIAKRDGHRERGLTASSDAELSDELSDERRLRDDFLSALAKLVKRDHHSVVLSVEPDTFAFDKPAGWVRSTNKVLPAETILLDLALSESELLAGMAKKTRQYIRKSSADVAIKPVRSREALDECLEIYRQTAARAGFNLHSQQYYRDVYLHMQDYSPIFAAYVDDKIVAFLWLAVSGETAYELYGGVNDIGQEVRANYALKWHAIRRVKEWGLHYYDFGGMVAGGVANFKQGWSRDETLFAGTFDKPLSPLYALWSKGLPFAKRSVQKLRRKR